MKCADTLHWPHMTVCENTHASTIYVIPALHRCHWALKLYCIICVHIFAECVWLKPFIPSQEWNVFSVRQLVKVHSSLVVCRGFIPPFKRQCPTFVFSEHQFWNPYNVDGTLTSCGISLSWNATRSFPQYEMQLSPLSRVSVWHRCGRNGRSTVECLCWLIYINMQGRAMES